MRALLDAAGLASDHVLGEVPERDRVITAEHLAINAAMAALSAQDTARIAEGVLATPRLPAEIAEILARAGEGNPVGGKADDQRMFTGQPVASQMSTCLEQDASKTGQ